MVSQIQSTDAICQMLNLRSQKVMKIDFEADSAMWFVVDRTHDLFTGPICCLGLAGSVAVGWRIC